MGLSADGAGGNTPPASYLNYYTITERWYSDRVAAWLAEFDIRACQGCTDRSGRRSVARHRNAYASMIGTLVHYGAAGRTASTLLVWGHEIGHIVLFRRYRLEPTKPRHLKEYEATVFGLRLLRRDGIVLPRRALDSFRGGIADIARRDARLGLPIRPDVARWCRLKAQEIAPGGDR